MSRINSDMFFGGTLRATTLVPSDGCVFDKHVAAAAAIGTAKQVHQHRATYSQPNTTATTETRIIHCVRGLTGTIKEIAAGSIVANVGAATVTVDLRKNGTTVLSSVITLNNTHTARQNVTGTIAGATVAAGDDLDIVITATAGGGTLATGVFVALTVDEDPVL